MHNRIIVPTHPNNSIRFNVLAKLLGLSYKELVIELGIVFRRPSVLIYLPFTNLRYEDNTNQYTN